MPDRFTHDERSRVMRAIKSVATGPEAIMRGLLDDLAMTYREQAADLQGRPDFVNDGIRLAIFVDGDWWHGRDWLERKEKPVANAPYWEAKFERNVRRDLEVSRRLRARGWSVIRVWETDLRSRPTWVMELIARRAQGRARRRRRAN